MAFSDLTVLSELSKEKFIQAILNEYKNNKDKISLNRAKEHMRLDLPVNNIFWKSNPDLLKYLQDNTFPKGVPFFMCTLKIYEKGQGMGLHMDHGFNKLFSEKIEYKPDEAEKNYDILKNYEYQEPVYTNSILIDIDPNTVGGDLVFAGEGWPPPRSPINIRSLKNPGDKIWWDSTQVHGVTEIEKGYRLSLIVMKSKNGKILDIK